MQRHCRSVYLSPHHRQRRICMVTDVLFHPDHVIPPPELIAALMEFAHHPVAQLFVERNAAGVGEGNAGIDIDDILLLQDIFQGGIQPGTDAASPCVL